jgi:hypothetical protein
LKKSLENFLKIEGSSAPSLVLIFVRGKKTHLLVEILD